MDDKTLNLWRQIEESRRAVKRPAPGRAKSATAPEREAVGN
jgi:hypothetical protein